MLVIVLKVHVIRVGFSFKEWRLYCNVVKPTILVMVLKRQDAHYTRLPKNLQIALIG